MSPGEPARVPALLPLSMVPEHDLLRPIAAGAYGQVWLARNRLGVYRAVKVVHRVNFDHDRPFEREFAGIKAFEPISRTHEGLVDLLQVGRDDSAGYFYYVMELADASPAQPGLPPDLRPAAGQAFDPRNADEYLPRTLGSELKRRGRFPLEECIRIALSLADALAHLHRQGLVHRDVKPSNIIFVDGAPKLADVGLVTSVDAARSFVGTEGFIPPEGPGTPQADIYSLGIVLYSMSTGKNHQAFPEPLSNLGGQPEHAARLELDAVIHKACQADARARYKTAEEMRQDLALLQRGGSVKRKRAAQRRWGISKRLGLAAAATGLLITGLLLWNGSERGHTPLPEAKRLYELGKWHYNLLNTENHQLAFRYLNQAIQLDSQYVQPYRELIALTVWARPGLFAGAEDRVAKVKEIADKLLALDPDLAEGHTALSFYRFLMQDWEGAEKEIVRAIELDPNYPIAHDIYGYYLAALGRVEEALREGERSQELDPTARASAVVAAYPYLAARQYDRAIAQVKRALELEKNFAEAYNFLGRCYEAQSNYLAAIDAFEKYDTLSGHDAARVTASYETLRRAYAAGGQEGYCRRYIELIHEQESLPESEQFFFVDDIAGYYVRLGEHEKAMDEIEKHLDIPAVRVSLRFDPFFDPLHSHPRFQALVRRAGLAK